MCPGNGGAWAHGYRSYGPGEPQWALCISVFHDTLPGRQAASEDRVMMMIWCKTEPPAHRGSGAHPKVGLGPVRNPVL
jgi:hypothetical protein